jgi:hypothetical protein
MDVMNLDRNQLYRWVKDELECNVLGGAKIGSVYSVSFSGEPATSHPLHLATAAVPVIEIDNCGAEPCDTFKAFLDYEPDARQISEEVDKILLQDTNVSELPATTTAQAAIAQLREAPLAALVSKVPTDEILRWMYSHSPLQVFKTGALAEDEILFIHVGNRPTSYLIRPLVGITNRGHRASINIRADVFKSKRDERVRISKARIL